MKISQILCSSHAAGRGIGASLRRRKSTIQKIVIHGVNGGNGPQQKLPAGGMPKCRF